MASIESVNFESVEKGVEFIMDDVLEASRIVKHFVKDYESAHKFIEMIVREWGADCIEVVCSDGERGYILPINNNTDLNTLRGTVVTSYGDVYDVDGLACALYACSTVPIEANLVERVLDEMFMS